MLFAKCEPFVKSTHLCSTETVFFVRYNVTSKVSIKMEFTTQLTHWGRVMHMRQYNIPILVRRQAIIWTNAAILLIGPLGTNFSEILTAIHTFSFKKMHLKISSAKMTAILSRPQCVNLCDAKTGIFQANQVNSMAANVLATREYSHGIKYAV